MAPNTVVTLDILFDHEIKGRELIRMIKEGIKHLLFIRRQLPLPLVLLQRERDSLQHRKQPNQRASAGTVAITKSRKKQTAISALEDAIDALDDFSTSRKVHAMAMLIGSTVVSPKEVFLLRPDFDRLEINQSENIMQEQQVLEGQDISAEKLMDKSGRNFVKSLVVNEDLSSLGDIRPTSVFFFVLAPRDTECCIYDKFLPKQSYKLPYKGKYYDIVLTDKGTICNPKPDKIHPVDKISNVQKQSDLIWYQANILFKGFKEAKTSAC